MVSNCAEAAVANLPRLAPKSHKEGPWQNHRWLVGDIRSGLSGNIATRHKQVCLLAKRDSAILSVNSSELNNDDTDANDARAWISSRHQISYRSGVRSPRTASARMIAFSWFKIGREPGICGNANWIKPTSFDNADRSAQNPSTWCPFMIIRRSNAAYIGSISEIFMAMRPPLSLVSRSPAWSDQIWSAWTVISFSSSFSSKSQPLPIKLDTFFPGNHSLHISNLVSPLTFKFNGFSVSTLTDTRSEFLISAGVPSPGHPSYRSQFLVSILLSPSSTAQLESMIVFPSSLTAHTQFFPGALGLRISPS